MMKTQTLSKIIGLVLLVLGVSFLLRNYHLNSLELWFGAALFGLAAVRFAKRYLHEESWPWAVIPSGLSATACVVLVLAALRLVPSGLTGTICLTGFSLTFWLLWFEQKGIDRYSWARYLGVLLAAGAILAFANFHGWLSTRWITPTLILLTGILLVLKNRRRNRNSANRA